MNIGWNSQSLAEQVIQFENQEHRSSINGMREIDRAADGSLNYTPVEFGALNLFSVRYDVASQRSVSGSMILEPEGSTCTAASGGARRLRHAGHANVLPFLPTTRASATVCRWTGRSRFVSFRLMISDAMISNNNNPSRPIQASSAVNYRTEPFTFRYADNSNLDTSCMLSDQLLWLKPAPATQIGAPKTPIFQRRCWRQGSLPHDSSVWNGHISSLFAPRSRLATEPYTNDSRAIGANKLSQWLGSRDNHGSSDHF